MNEPLFELVSDENGTARRPVTPDPDWTPILADRLIRWAARLTRNRAAAQRRLRLAAKPGLPAAPTQSAQ